MNYCINKSLLQICVFPVLLTFIMLLSSQCVGAATVNGYAFKEGQTDHSGIAVQLQTPLPVPASGIFGCVLLLVALSLYLINRRKKTAATVIFILGLVGAGSLIHAFVLYSTTTSIDGDWSINDVDPGDYWLTLSAPGYTAHFDTVTINTGTNTIPPITLDTAPTPTPSMAGSIYSVDSIVGNMRYVPPGSFVQGSPDTEPCRDIFNWERQFTHHLTRSIAVMETEVSRQMWADLKAVQMDLPEDPSWVETSPTLNHPVQQATWYDAILFANLLSLHNGLTPCYYADSAFTIPIDSSIYTSGPFFCNFNASGYRLPFEGEWEYFCRAGTTDAFSCSEPNFTSLNCSMCTGGIFPTLEQYCVFCVNNFSSAGVIGSKLANPWNLKDVHGNVLEWCWDFPDDNPASEQIDYTGSIAGSDRITRGGEFYNDASPARSAKRFYFSPSYSSPMTGFRLIRTIDAYLPTPTPTRTPATCSAGDLFSSDLIIGDLRCVPGGSFIQGAPSAESCGWTDDETEFTHHLTRMIAVMETEVTRQMWADLKAAQPSLPDDPSFLSTSPGLNYPVQHMSWREAVFYANLLSLNNGYTRAYYSDTGFTIPITEFNYQYDSIYCNFEVDGYRLPSEGEWEHFARAGTTGPYWAVEPDYSCTTYHECYPSQELTVLNSIAWWCGNSGSTGHPVGAKAANPWNLYDVHGNVMEWCWDWYAVYPGESTDYTGTEIGSNRIFRGGCIYETAVGCRSSVRFAGDMGWSADHVGFRLVRTIG